MSNPDPVESPRTTPAPMRKDIYENGENVAMVHSLPSDDIEAWVLKVRALSNVEDVDWHFIGGRGRVAALGTPEELKRVRDAIRELAPSFNEAVAKLYPQFYGDGREKPSCVAIYGGSDD